MKKIVISIFVIGLLLTTSIPNVNAFIGQRETNRSVRQYVPTADIYVDDDAPPEWYDETHVKTINEGIEVAEDGDTVFVFNGYYDEGAQLNIDKSINLMGEDKYQTSIEVYGDFSIEDVDGLKMSGFTLEVGIGGLSMSGCFNCIVQDNVVESRGTLRLSQSSYNTITGNAISKRGINIWASSHNNIISENNIMGGGINIDWGVNNTKVLNNNINGGIELTGSSGSIISNNIIGSTRLTFGCSNNMILNNTLKGPVRLAHSCNNNTIDNNTITGYGVEISLESSNNIISGNTISNINGGNHAFGIMLHGFCGPNNIISGNTISNIKSDMWAFGIELDASHTVISGNIISNIDGGRASGIDVGSTGNTITRNKISYVDGSGIYIYNNDNKVIANNLTNNGKGITVEFSNNLIYYNNFINNGLNGNNYPFQNNQWYLPVGAFKGKGNYWDDYTGKDSDGDGIGDTSYDVYQGEKDRFPFMEPIDIENIAINFEMTGEESSQSQQSTLQSYPSSQQFTTTMTTTGQSNFASQPTTR